MPRTAHWVLPAAALTWLKNNGFVHSTATQVRIEIRPGLPATIYTDRGNRTPAGTIVTAAAVRDWLQTGGRVNQHIHGLYIDCPAEVTDMSTVTARAQLTNAFQVQALLDLLAQTSPLR